MFGSASLPEITLNFANVKSYWPFLTTITLFAIVINSMTKYPLLMTPLLKSLESFSTIIPRNFAVVLLNCAVLLTSIILPSFEKIMGVLGASFSSVIAIVFPCMCYLQMFPDCRLSKRVLLYIIIFIGIIIGIFGTMGTVSTRKI